MKVGDIVKASYMTSGFNGTEPSETFTGIVTSFEVKESLFSDKYAIVESETVVEVLCNGCIKTFVLEEDNIEVINESRCDNVKTPGESIK